MEKNKKEKDLARETTSFYSSSQIYLDRLKTHGEETFASYIKLCKSLIPSNSSILDCGCGIGVSSYLLAKEGLEVTGTDISPLFISEARKNYGNQPNLTFLIENACKMSFQNSAFDAVCSFDLLEHVTDIDSTLKEMSRVLKNNGLLIIVMPNHLDPIQHLLASIRWKAKNKYKPWEAKSRIEAFYQFIKTTFLCIAKATGINRKKHYLQPVLSDDVNFCGEDFDATWLANWFDVCNSLKDIGFSIKNTTSQNFESSKVIRIMRKFKLPKIIQSFYKKIRMHCVIVAVKNETSGRSKGSIFFELFAKLTFLNLYKDPKNK